LISEKNMLVIFIIDILHLKCFD